MSSCDAPSALILLDDPYPQLLDPAALGAEHGDETAVDPDLVSLGGYLAKLVIDQTTERVKLVDIQVQVECLVDVSDRNPRVDDRLALVDALDSDFFMLVVLVP